MQIHYFAAAKQARGVATEQLEQDFATLGQLITWLGDQHQGTTQAGSSLAEVLRKCSFLINGHHAEPSATVPKDARIDILPPFSGG